MVIRRPNGTKRRGAAAVEMAFVVLLLLMMLFGIIEYCRLLFVWHVANNAARDAARFAAVHTGGGTMPGEPTTISQSDIDTIVRTGQFNGTYVGAGLCGMEGNIENLVIDIFTVDPAGLAQSPAVAQQLSGSTWASAGFSQNIGIRISGNYRPVLPSLLFMGSTVPFQVTVMVTSEGN